MTISERIFYLLDNTPGKNAAGMSKILGVGTSQTTSWKQRNADPPARYIPQISEFLGVSMSYLLTGEEEAPVSRGPSLTDDELLLLDRYRSLDTDGKEIVRVTALQEKRRVEASRGADEAKIG